MKYLTTFLKVDDGPVHCSHFSRAQGGGAETGCIGPDNPLADWSLVGLAFCTPDDDPLLCESEGSMVEEIDMWKSECLEERG